MFLGFHVGPEDGVHAGEVALAVGLEPVNDVAVEAEVDGGLAGRHDDAGGAPEVGAEGFGFGGGWAGGVFAAFAHGLDLAKRVSHDGRFQFHLCSLSGR